MELMMLVFLMGALAGAGVALLGVQLRAERRRRALGDVTRLCQVVRKA